MFRNCTGTNWVMKSQIANGRMSSSCSRYKGDTLSIHISKIQPSNWISLKLYQLSYDRPCIISYNLQKNIMLSTPKGSYRVCRAHAIIIADPCGLQRALRGSPFTHPQHAADCSTPIRARCFFKRYSGGTKWITTAQMSIMPVNTPNAG